MVRKSLLVILFLLLIPLQAYSQDVKVSAAVDEDLSEGKPVTGSVTITHNSSFAVDPDSFRVGTEPLKVDFLKDVQISPSSDLIISIYNFSLEPKPVGLHVLPEVSVKVGGKEYRSIQASYEVASKYGGSTRPGTTGPSVILRFEEIINGPTTLYPGERITVGYRFVFNYSVELAQEQIPLLDAKGFEKIGSKQTKEFVQGALNFLEVTQVIQAVEPGEYTFPKGVLQGRAYRLDKLKRKEYASTESRVESNSATLHVLPFPTQGKPPSFNGALGESLDFETSLLSSDKINVGDKIVLLIKMSGQGQLDNMPMPEVCCQPGYSGFFRLSDLPPVEQVTGNTKTFKVEMRPLNASIKEIPPLEFSFFDPKKKAYTTKRSAAIPLAVLSLKGKPAEAEKQLPEEMEKGMEEKPKTQKLKPTAIEIKGNYLLTYEDVTNKPFGTWRVLLLLPFLLGAIVVQRNMRQFVIAQRGRIKPKGSTELYQQAFKEEQGSSEFFNLLQRAFLLRLFERGEIHNPDLTADQLSDIGASGKVKELLGEIEKRRFAPKETAVDEELIEQIRSLFKELKP